MAKFPIGSPFEWASRVSSRLKLTVIPRSVRLRTFALWVSGLSIFAIAAFGFSVYSADLKVQATYRLAMADDALEQQRIADAAEAAAAAEAARIKIEEDTMALGGYKPAGNGVYYRWAKKREFHCGYLDCAAIVVATGSQSCSSVYVEANITSGGVAIGIANATVGALGEWDVAAMVLEDYLGGDGFRLSKINCW